MIRKKLVIPKEVINWIVPGLAERNGEIQDCWDSRLEKLGWLEDVKQPELMTLQEVVLLCHKNGGTFYGKTEPEIKLYVNKHGMVLFKDDDSELDSSVEYFEKMWIYEPAEPKVLSFDDIFCKVGNNSGEYRGFKNTDIEYAIKLADENQMLNHKELREAVERFEIECTDETISAIFKALKNLKPLKAE